jgi:hypothetical protein
MSKPAHEPRQIPEGRFDPERRAAVTKAMTDALVAAGSAYRKQRIAGARILIPQAERVRQAVWAMAAPTAPMTAITRKAVL